ALSSGTGHWPDPGPIAQQSGIEIGPAQIVRFDERNFPIAAPALDLLLALDRELDAFVPLVPDERLHAIFLCEARQKTLFVLPDSPDEIVCHARIERSVGRARQHVDPIGMFAHATPWVPDRRFAASGMTIMACERGERYSAAIAAAGSIAMDSAIACLARA